MESCNFKICQKSIIFSKVVFILYYFCQANHVKYSTVQSCLRGRKVSWYKKDLGKTRHLSATMIIVTHWKVRQMSMALVALWVKQSGKFSKQLTGFRGFTTLQHLQELRNEDHIAPHNLLVVLSHIVLLRIECLVATCCFVSASHYWMLCATFFPLHTMMYLLESRRFSVTHQDLFLCMTNRFTFCLEKYWHICNNKQKCCSIISLKFGPISRKWRETT